MNDELTLVAVVCADPQISLGIFYQPLDIIVWQAVLFFGPPAKSRTVEAVQAKRRTEPDKTTAVLYNHVDLPVRQAVSDAELLHLGNILLRQPEPGQEETQKEE